MGYRLHYTKKYDVEYGGGYFNHHPLIVNELLRDLVFLVRGHIYYDEEEIGYSKHFEIDKTSFLDVIKYFKGEYLLNDDDFYDEEELSYAKENIDKSLTVLDYTKEKFAELLQSIYDNSAPEISYVRLEWY